MELNDTSKAAERMIIEGYRSMTPTRKLQQFVALTQTIQRFALTRLRQIAGTRGVLEFLERALREQVKITNDAL